MADSKPHTHTAEVIWERGEQPFSDRRYSRKHTLRFDGGVEVAGSSSPHVVPVPMSDPQAVDPEEGFIAAIASCHMLWFLDIAARQGYVVDSYHDSALGVMGANADKKLWVASVTLQPQVRFAGPKQPTASELEALHHTAHAECFIANSVKTDIQVQPR
ncbi:OsmC family protein [Curvibacter sp. CHRR-16]|uniref:OsmC family protein n=1 Tax=Curvibacter sp. CHRR-16 TaxID=2835872 RepID=UPI001BDA6E3E|nr:OsmC family protein [Curvibacter sp. CHRR-16]MBT0570290.1 OsmC family protein [Curvibacter sp. CHRR-16]